MPEEVSLSQLPDVLREAFQVGREGEMVEGASSGWSEYEGSERILVMVPSSEADEYLSRDDPIGCWEAWEHPAEWSDNPLDDVFGRPLRTGDDEASFITLVHRWPVVGSEKIWRVDDRFLAAYSLAPRIAGNLSDPQRVIHWDDPNRHHDDVIVVESKSAERWGTSLMEASIRFREDYLQDFATWTDHAIFQAAFVTRFWEAGASDLEPDADEGKSCYEGPGFHACISSLGDGRIRGDVYGLIEVCLPDDRPILEWDEDPCELEWPGLDGTRSRPVGMDWPGRHMERIWVKDSVLERFEDTGSGYEVMPESGAVSGPGGGWGYCQRVDRNHIRMELKKLYGSAPPWMIRHVHDHAVQPPTPGVTDEPNIATRTQALFEAMKELDRALRSLSRALGVDSSDPGPTGWAYEDLDHRGWWKDETWARLSHHVPEDLDLDQFLERCNRLWQIFDRASESDLRAILRECGGVPDSDWQSLKLLEEIVRRCRTAQDTGLELTADSEAIVSRLEGEREQLAVMAPPFRTNEIRQASAHTRSDREAKVREELAALDLDLNSYGSNLGFCYDDLMDKFTAAIQQIAASIRRAPV